MLKIARDVNRYFPLGVQVNARARRDLELTEPTLDPPEGRTFFALREISRALRLRTGRPEVGAGRLNLLAVLCTAQRLLVARYLERHGGRILPDGLELPGGLQSPAGWSRTLSSFIAGYPPARAASRRYLEAGDGPARVFCELLVLATQAGNRAAAPFLPLFETGDLDAACPWRQLLAECDGHLAAGRDTGALSGSLLALLAEPLQAAPDSLEGQVRYVRQHWSDYLPEEFLSGLETAFAVLEEEQRQRGGVHGPVPVPTFPRTGPGADEPEAFSADAAWMSSTVLLAKSVYVWLDQLSTHYGREVTRLDQIPAEELDRLAGWGISSLWLIGIWCRSEASRTIKQRMGNPEAVASAYSLDDYVVAGELGGDAALEELEKQCARRGIRLACDVVPNHTGIDSRWTREHPDWYLQIDHPPYPAYRFTGPDLSSDPAIELRIEDGYWNHTDAAVVFERRDRRSGEVRYIYHGNDGTHMPWNDTAQLNFLLPEVREAMIRTIIDVARRFRIIRFDAAMTLAKKHFQRLWFPLPGGGAGVPSRAEHALSREEFEGAFPVEFWREVVDRVAVEVPDTLLLAEAFWLMEGYFVRTLGMHRVYNSAFMNMLKTEENAKYRSVIKNVLEFNPEILKRFVNFMNNPDEATAVEQFGKGDKYFGVVVMLATLPGLPMFGHGQFEGLKEKYGMEYRRAYWDEAPDAPFMAHHENQVCPLLRNRHLFSEAEHFELYDFISGGHVNEDVFAYSNRAEAESTLVVYHNRAGETGGWLRDAVPKARLRPGRSGLAAALGLDPGTAPLWRCREHRDGLEYLLPTADLASDGLHLQLGPYAYRVYHKIRAQSDADGSWQEFCRHLNGAGVPDLDREYHRWRHRDLTQALDRLLDPELTEALLAGVKRKGRPPLPGRERWLTRLTEFYRLLAAAAGVTGTPASLAVAVTRDLEALQGLYAATSRSSLRRRELEALRGLTRAQTTLERFDPLLPVLLVLLRSGELVPRSGAERRAAAWIASFPLADALPAADYPDAAGLLRLLVAHPEAWTGSAAPDPLPPADTPEGRSYLQVHEAGGTVWFSRDRFHTLCKGLTLAAAATACGGTATDRSALAEQLAAISRRYRELLKRAAAGGYRFEVLLEKPQPQPSRSGQRP